MATPGRLFDFAERGHVTSGSLQFLILDEADRMLDQGFMPDIRRAISIPSMPSKKSRQILMFSATFPPEIQRCAGEFLNNYLHLQVKSALSLWHPVLSYLVEEFRQSISFFCVRCVYQLHYLLLRLDLLAGLVQMLCKHFTEPRSMRRRTSSSVSSMRMDVMPRRGRWCLLRPRGRRTSSASTFVRR